MAETEPGMAELHRASVQGRIGLGRGKGQRLVRFVGEAAGGADADADPGSPAGYRVASQEYSAPGGSLNEKVPVSFPSESFPR